MDQDKLYYSKMLLALLGGDVELSNTWWITFNKAFSRTPDEMWEIDKTAVKAYIMYYYSN